MTKKTRTETDSFGPIAVPADKLWGAQTERSRQNFRIGVRRLEAKNFQLAAHAFSKQRSRQIVHFGRAEIDYRRRACQAAGTCTNQQAKVESRKIALPDECFSSFGHTPEKPR